MSDSLQDKLVDAVVKGIVTAITGSGLWQLSGGEFFGRFMLTGFEHALAVTIRNTHLLDSHTYGLWSQELLTEPARANPGAWAILPLLALFLLIAHVVFRQSLPQAKEKADTYGLIPRLYVRFYFHLTFLLLAGGLTGLFLISHEFWLVSAAALLVIPTLAYLFFYPKDLRANRFGARFAYICAGLLTVMSLMALPYVYGRRALDLKLEPVLRLAGEPRLEQTFVFDSRSKTFGRVIPESDGLSIELFTSRAGFEVASTRASLRAWLTEYAPFTGDSGAQVYGDFRSILETAVSQ